MTIKRSAILGLAAVLTIGGFDAVQEASAESITVDIGTEYETVDGWEATAIWDNVADNGNYTPRLIPFRDQVADVAVNQLGLNRVRLEIQTGNENPVDYWQQFFNGQIDYDTLKGHFFHKINDNADPNVINSAGYQFTYIDGQIENVILPMKQRLEANGDSIYISLCVVDFNNGRNGNTSSLSVSNSPDEYAELIEATVDHVATKYGLTIDALEIILEPDNSSDWNGSGIGTRIGNNLVAAVNRLQNSGYNLREVIAPSNVSMAAAISTFDEMIQVPGVLGLLTTFSYHKYSGVSAANRQAIANRANTHSLKTSMLEHFTDKHIQLLDDLRDPKVSSYQRWAYAAPDSSAYIFTDFSNANNPVFTLSDGVHAMSQVFKYVKIGAVQLGVSSGNGVAYRNPNGQLVAVFLNNSFGTHTVSGLPAGTYGITSTGNDSVGVLQLQSPSPDVTIGAGESLSFDVLTTAGLVTVFSKSLQTSDTIAPNPPTNVNAY